MVSRAGRGVSVRRFSSLTVVIVFCGGIATGAVLAATAIALHYSGREIERQALKRYAETGALLTATVARMAEQYIDQPERNRIALAALAETAGAIEGSRGLTISGAPANASTASHGMEYIWASSAERYWSPDGTLRYEAGRTRILDELSSEIGRIIASVNQDAAQELADLSPQIEEVTRTIVRLLTQDHGADESELAEMDNIFRVLYRRGSDRLAEVGRRHAGTVPSLEVGSLRDLGDDVLFFHPIASFDRSERAWYAGMVRLRRDVEPLLRWKQQAVAAERSRAWRSALAIIGGVWGILPAAWILMRRLRGNYS